MNALSLAPVPQKSLLSSVILSVPEGYDPRQPHALKMLPDETSFSSAVLNWMRAWAEGEKQTRLGQLEVSAIDLGSSDAPLTGSELIKVATRSCQQFEYKTPFIADHPSLPSRLIAYSESMHDSGGPEILRRDGSPNWLFLDDLRLVNICFSCRERHVRPHWNVDLESSTKRGSLWRIDDMRLLAISKRY